MKITQEQFNFEGLKVTQTITETKKERFRHNEVMIYDEKEDSWEIISPRHERYSIAIILMHNEKIRREIIKI